MIDFSKITKTIGGLDCYYLGQRTSGGQVINRFAVFNNAAELFCYYNEQGQRIDYVGLGKWVAAPTGHQIIAPPKIVEVTQYIALYEKAHYPGEYYLVGAKDERDLPNSQFLRGSQQHTFRFEVPNE